MIVAISRDRWSHFLTAHGSDLEAWWLSPGAYTYLTQHGYRVHEMERVSDFLVERMKVTGHLRPMSQAPKLGEFQDAFVP